MWKIAKHICTAGLKSERIVRAAHNVEQVGLALKQKIAKKFSRSLAIRMVDAGSCNACELEIQATTNPYYNMERFGIHFVASPRHADMLLVTGPVTKNMQQALIKTYEALAHPKLVIAIGDCAHCGGIYKDSYAIIGAVSDVIPVNYVVKGCPPTPLNIINGILHAISA